MLTSSDIVLDRQIAAEIATQRLNKIGAEYNQQELDTLTDIVLWDLRQGTRSPIWDRLEPGLDELNRPAAGIGGVLSQAGEAVSGVVRGVGETVSTVNESFKRALEGIGATGALLPWLVGGALALGVIVVLSRGRARA